MRLFVDCDDTLVIWQNPHVNQDSNVWMGESWKPNDDLIFSINFALNLNPDIQLIIWSGGGVDYASRWAFRFFPNIPYLALAKDISLPTKEDICIDDMPIKVEGILLTPAEFITQGEHIEA